MLVRTDDEVYRVDAVWLGPPRATFPWRARYVSYGVGLLVMMLIMFVQRRLGIGLDFFSVAWALVGTVAITRLLGKKIDYERPLGQVLGQFWAEVTGPRAGRKAAGGSVRAGHVRVHTTRAHPGVPSAGGRTPALSTAQPTRIDAARTRPPVTVDAAVDTPATTATVVPGLEAPVAAPARVVPPLPEPGSATRRSRFRRARGGGSGRGASVPARTPRPDPWRRSGHRGRT